MLKPIPFRQRSFMLKSVNNLQCPHAPMPKFTLFTAKSLAMTGKTNQRVISYHTGCRKTRSSHVLLLSPYQISTGPLRLLLRTVTLPIKGQRDKRWCGGGGGECYFRQLLEDFVSHR